MTDTPTPNLYPESTMPPQTVIDQQALNAVGAPTTIAPWGRIVFMETIGSSIHGKSPRPIA